MANRGGLEFEGAATRLFDSPAGSSMGPPPTDETGLLPVTPTEQRSEQRSLYQSALAPMTPATAAAFPLAAVGAYVPTPASGFRIPTGPRIRPSFALGQGEDDITAPAENVPQESIMAPRGEAVGTQDASIHRVREV